MPIGFVLIAVLILLTIIFFIAYWRGHNPLGLAVVPSRLMMVVGALLTLYIYATAFFELPIYDFWPPGEPQQ